MTRPALRIAFIQCMTAYAALIISTGSAIAQEPATNEPASDLRMIGPVAPDAHDTHPTRAVPPPAIPMPLHRAAAIAAATHPLVRAADAEARALRAELRAARWLRYPSLNVEALAATQGSNIADSDGLAVNVALEQPVWSGGRISSEIDRAHATLAAGSDQVDEAERRIVLDVTSAYYDTVLAAERAAVLTDSLARHEELVASIERRVAQEVSPRADLTLGNARTSQVRLDLASATELRDSARIRLLELTGGVEIQPEMPPSGVAQTLPPADLALAEALQCDPTLAALTDLVDAAEANRRIARGTILPQVLLQLSQNEITGARAAVVLRAQTGNGLSQFARVDSAAARIERALAEFGEAERRLREQLRRDYVLVAAARERIEAGTLAADAAADIIESYQRQFIAGRRSWLDVMNAVREAASARLAESDARVTLAAGAARILTLSCRWEPVPIGPGQRP